MTTSMMEADTTERAIAAACENVRVRREQAGDRTFVGLYQDGGIGDLMRQIAFARAVRRRFPAAYILLVCRDLGEDADGRPMVANIVGGTDAVDATLCLPPIQCRRVTALLYDLFDVFYRVGYVVEAWYWRLSEGEGDAAEEQRQADLHLQPFRRFAAKFPTSSAGIRELQMTQWEVMRRSSGLDVSEDDLAIETGECPEWLSRKRCAVVHNMCGGMALAKSAPMSVFSRLIAELGKRRVRCVQLGAPNDPAIPGAKDFRGLPIRDSAEVLRRATLLIDVEGGLGYIARAVGTRRACFFGPTPPELFRFERDLILSTRKCEPCWHTTERWSVSCPEQWPCCRNIPTDAEQIATILAPYARGEK
ncbi:MAG: glycosyltransferase family 9 protein [Planctomycetota bacterium]